MRIAVTGSIATDHLMTFAGRFGEQLLPDQLAHLSVSFLVDDLEIRRGGVAANICFGLARSGCARCWSDRSGTTSPTTAPGWTATASTPPAVLTSATRHTARFVCTTDSDQNQIASFYPGAMSEARDIDLTTLGDLDLVLVSANDPDAMLRSHRGVPGERHPVRGRRLPAARVPRRRGDPPAARRRRRCCSATAYEAALLESKTGWSAAEMLDRVGIRVTTHGAEGIVIERAGEQTMRIGVVPAREVVEPTGVGDAFRAGFLPAGRGTCPSSGRPSWAPCSPRRASSRSVRRSTVFDAAQASERLTAAYWRRAAATEIAQPAVADTPPQTGTKSEPALGFCRAAR